MIGCLNFFLTNQNECSKRNGTVRKSNKIFIFFQEVAPAQVPVVAYNYAPYPIVAAPVAPAADTARANITSNRFLAAEIFIVPGKEFKNKA